MALEQVDPGADWTSEVESAVAEAIRNCLSVGNIGKAARIEAATRDRNSQGPYMQEMRRFFGPATLVSLDEPRTDLNSNWQWLKTHAQEYTGLWVAVSYGQLVAAEPTLARLRQALDLLKIQPPPWSNGSNSQHAKWPVRGTILVELEHILGGRRRDRRRRYCLPSGCFTKNLRARRIQAIISRPWPVQPGKRLMALPAVMPRWWQATLEKSERKSVVTGRSRLSSRFSRASSGTLP